MAGLELILFSDKRLRAAYDQLKNRDIHLASYQVNYNLIYRLPEENGVKLACDELGITLIAYSLLAQELQPLIHRIKEIEEGYDETPTQVRPFNCYLVYSNFSCFTELVLCNLTRIYVKESLLH
ncbi:hypothetical protein DH2020_016039 [Rehmannia glutinosa]|uniref:Uncharacterized protein n=1 Tax=Rehmannia glutinosa TaxID=99300 RepID=A0ABR0WXK9_REHGL